MLEQSNYYKGYQHAVSDPQELRTLPANYVQRRPREIREQFRRYQAEGLLSKQFLDLVLTDEEQDVVTEALLGLIHREPEVARAAVSALGITGRLDIMPALSEVVFRKAKHDDDVAHTAVMAIASLLESSAMKPQAPLSTEQKSVLQQAIATLRVAAREGTLEVRETAERYLTWLSEHFGVWP